MLFQLWWAYANINPTLTIPTPLMPLPNAFDYFVKAGHIFVDNNKIADALKVTPSTSIEKPLGHIYTSADKTALVQENTGSFKLLRQGFIYPYENPKVRSFSTYFHYYVNFRGIARLLALEGQVKDAKGDFTGAVSSRLDAVELGVKIPHGSSLIGMLVGLACQAIGRQPFANVMQEEKWQTEGSLMEAFHTPDWGADFAYMNTKDGNLTPEMIEARYMLDLTPKKSVISGYSDCMNQSIADAHAPYAKWQPIPETPLQPLNAILCPDAKKSDLKYTDNLAQNVFLMFTLALRAYRLAPCAT